MGNWAEVPSDLQRKTRDDHMMCAKSWASLDNEAEHSSLLHMCFGSGRLKSANNQGERTDSLSIASSRPEQNDHSLWGMIKAKLSRKKRIKVNPHQRTSSSLSCDSSMFSKLSNPELFNKICANKRTNTVDSMLKQTDSILDVQYEKSLSSKNRLQVRSCTRIDEDQTSSFNSQAGYSKTRTLSHGYVETGSESLQNLIDIELERDKNYVETMLQMLMK